MRGVLVILILLVAFPAAAQTVTFRSGEHARFSRLVLDIPPGRAWSLGRLGPDYRLDLGDGVTFDPTGAFERIPRDRIAALDVAGEGGRLILRLGCSDCHATAFLHAADKLVIDIADGPPPPGSPFEIEAPGAPLPDSTLPVVAAPPLPLLGTTGVVADLLFDPGTQAPDDEPSPKVPAVGALAIDMARAVAAGVLDAPATAPAPIVRDEPSPPPPPAVLADPAPLAAGPGISFITADMPTDVPGPRALSRSGHACRPDSDIDLAAWGESGDFSSEIASLRGAIVNAAGEVDDEAAAALARGYLHFAFGAEARHALAIGAADSTEARFLMLLADIIDGRPVQSGLLSDQAGCLGAIALWSALADGTLAGRTAAERTAIEATLRVLPPAPRRTLVPRVAGLFLATGYADTATALLALIPADATADEDVVHLRSDIARAGETAGAATAARAELLKGIESGSRMGAGTMVRLVDTTLASGQAVEPWMTETLASLRFEQRGGPMAGPLAATEIRARIAGGDITEAMRLLQNESLPITRTDREELSDTLASAVAETADDAQFLAFAFAETPLPLSAAGTHAVAARLIALGFPDVALDLLATPAPTPAMRDRRLLRAAALRDLGQMEEAALVLTGIPEPGAGTVDPADAWRAGDWEELRSGDDPLLAAAAEAQLSAGPPPLVDGSLADRAALIWAAEATRSLAQDLLARFPAPPDEDLP